MMVNRYIIKKTLTSSSIPTAGVDITDNAFGEFLITNVVLKTDSTGLAGGTNLQVTINNAKGLATCLEETVDNLGANKCVDMSSASVSKQPTVLENGKKITIKSTVGACTGSGTIDIYVIMEKLDQGSSINVI